MKAEAEKSEAGEAMYERGAKKGERREKPNKSKIV